jgi:hypothetical protein
MNKIGFDMEGLCTKMHRASELRYFLRNHVRTLTNIKSRNFDVGEVE